MPLTLPEIKENNIVLDQRSYHLFEYKDDKLLYDISTGIVCELNDFSYKLLKLCGQYPINNILHIIKKEYPGVTKKEILDNVVEPLRSRGLFLYRPCNVISQQKKIDGLWRHKPRRLQLFLAQACNLACKYCYAENNGSNAKHTLMTWDVAKRSVDYLVKKSGNRKDLQVTFFGGEPLLNFKVLKKVVRYCEDISKQAKKTFVFELICNGTLLDKEITDYVADRNFLLFISIDGFREMHNYQRPSVDGIDLYDTILENAKYAIKKYRQLRSRRKIKIRANMTNKFHDATRIAKYLEDMGFDKIGIAAIQPMPFTDCTPCALSDEQLDKLDSDYEDMILGALAVMEKNEKLPPFASRLIYRLITRQLRANDIMGITCGIGRNTNAVDCRGNIFPCHRYVGLDKYILGNIYEGLSPSKTISLYNKYSERALSQCSNCWARTFCSGGCPWEVSSPDGEICKKKSSMCDRTKKSIKRALWLDKEIRKKCPERYAAINRFHEKEDRLSSWNW